jgi:hypothetical protein
MNHGLPSLEATASRRTIYDVREMLYLHGYKGIIARNHVCTIINQFSHSLVEANMINANIPPSTV